jgi:peptidoglycan/xylan/chitin deacetylase (PgdA/CDA1 family)
MNAKMKVVQCWDDGVTTDERLVDILRKHKAKATFNLNAGLHEPRRKMGWTFKDTEVWRLGWDEMRPLYEGFVVANHSLTHPHLEKLPIAEARRDIADGRKRLQDFFGQPVRGFAYPFGSYSEAVKNAVLETGHVYARTCRNIERPFPPEDAMEFDSCGHFLATDFWDRYEKARPGGVFYFWGHSYEMITEDMWRAMDEKIGRISADTEAEWANVSDLFE